LDVHTPQSLDASPHGALELIKNFEVDVVVVVAYGLLVPPALLDVTEFGWVNVHFSRLPKWRGAAPVQHAIAHGDPTIGVTTFRIDAGLDTGPVLLRSPDIEISDHEDSGHLLQRLAPIGATLLVRTLDSLAAGVAHPTDQGDQQVSVAPRLTTAQSRIDWSMPVIDVDRWIRACTPAPGAWTTFAEHRLGIGTPAGVRVDPAAEPGAVVVEKRAVLVGARGGYCELDQVQPSGKKWMSADAWLRGLRTDERHVR